MKSLSLFIFLGSLLLSGCSTVKISEALKPIPIPEKISTEKVELTADSQKRITTIIASSKENDPVRESLKNSELYECLIQRVTGKKVGAFYHNAYIVSAKNGSIVMNKDNPNMFFGSASKVVKADDGNLVFVDLTYL